MRHRVAALERFMEPPVPPVPVRPGEEAMGSLATPTLEEAYLAETDIGAGERQGADQWAFLDGKGWLGNG